MECRCRFRYYVIVLLCLTYWVPSEISLLFVEGVGVADEFLLSSHNIGMNAGFVATGRTLAMPM
eukprot:5943919-Prorocentrum_lima.AAC.1